MQLSYDVDYPVGIEGQIIEDVPYEIITGIAEAAALPVGKLVIYDTANGRSDKAVRAAAATGDITGPAVAGISVWDPTFPFQTGIGAPVSPTTYPQNKTLPVLRKGRILLAAETVLTKAIRPFVRFGGTGTPGSIRADADTVSSADHAVAAPYLTVITPAIVIGGLVVVEINL